MGLNKSKYKSMKQYRLKKEAVQFFKKDLATSIQSFDAWESIGVDIEALEDIEEVYLEYGHQSLKSNSSSLSGWDENKGAHFYFTINFPSVKYNEHDKFSNGKQTRELMNKIQNSINYYYQDFINETKD